MVRATPFCCLHRTMLGLMRLATKQKSYYEGARTFPSHASRLHWEITHTCKSYFP
jgi:hypothetical protein